MMLINGEKLNRILKSFHTLTGVRIAIFNEQRREIASYPKQLAPFCRILRTNPDFEKRCRECDRRAFLQAEKTGQQVIYPCHAGLYESICPIRAQGRTVGFLMIGQFLSRTDCQQLQKRVQQSGDGELLRAARQLQTLDTESIEAIASILSVCAEYLCFTKTVSAHQTTQAEKAARYVREHLHEPISVRDLAEALGVSRTSVYLLFKNNFGKSVTEYVNSVRIERAQELVQAKLPTERILEEICVTDANYFYRLFRRHTGMTLSEYRKSRE